MQLLQKLITNKILQRYNDMLLDCKVNADIETEMSHVKLYLNLIDKTYISTLN